MGNFSFGIKKSKKNFFLKGKLLSLQFISYFCLLITTFRPLKSGNIGTDIPLSTKLIYIKSIT